MKNWLKYLKDKLKTEKWRIPDLSNRDIKNNKSESVVENIINFKKEESEKKKKPLINRNKNYKFKKTNEKHHALTMEERMTPSQKRKKGIKQTKSWLNKPKVRKIIGPMDITYVQEKTYEDSNNKTTTIDEKNYKTTITNEKFNDYYSYYEDSKESYTISYVYNVEDVKDKELEIVISTPSKWLSHKKGIAIGKTVKYDLDSNIEEEVKIHSTISFEEMDKSIDNGGAPHSSLTNVINENQKKYEEGSSVIIESDDEETKEEDELIKYESVLNEKTDEEYIIEEENDNDSEDYTEELDPIDLNDELEDVNVTDLDDYTDEIESNSINEEVNTDDEEEFEGSYDVQSIDEDDEYFEESFNDDIIEEDTIDNIEDYFSNYELPPFSLLDPIKVTSFDEEREEEAKIFTRHIEDVIAIMDLKLYIESKQIGSRVVKFQCPIDPKYHNFRLNEDFIKRVKAMIGNDNIRFEFPVYGKSNTFGIEVPFIKSKSVLVQMKEVMDNIETNNDIKKDIVFPLGLDMNGNYPIGDFSELVHILVAGYTGSGKSVFLQSVIITFLLRTNPKDLRLILIDPKQVEFSKYENLPHLLTPIINDPSNAILVLQKLVSVMEKRYLCFKDKKVKDITSFNKIASKKEKMPFIIVIIDELADLIMAVQDNSLESAIVRLAQKSRAAGIHMIVSTQRPSAEVITGLIKSNLPTRIAFALATGTDSRIILDEMGAELLLGRGDMLYKKSGSNIVERLQGVFTSEQEIDRIVDWVENQAKPFFDKEFLNLKIKRNEGNINEGFKLQDKISKEHIMAIDLIINGYDKRKIVSISGLQRALGIGHSKAARIVDALANKGVVTEDTGKNKPREIIGSILDLKEIKKEWLEKL